MLTRSTHARNSLLCRQLSSRSGTAAQSPRPPYNSPKRINKTSFRPDAPETNALFASIKEQISRMDGPSHANETNTSIQKDIRTALHARDVLAIWEHWQCALTEHSLALLDDSLIFHISSCIATKCFSKKPGEVWDSQTQNAIHELSLALASRAAYDALATCLLAYIRDRDPASVLQLYARFMQGKTESWSKAVEEEEDEEAAAAAEVESNLAPVSFGGKSSSRHIPGRAAILLAAVAAHALQGSLHGAVRIYSNTGIRFQAASTRSFTSKVKNKELSIRMHDYVDRLDAARTILIPGLLPRRIATLSRDGDAKTVHELYKYMIDGLSGKNIYLILSGAKCPPSSTFITLPDTVWPVFLKGFLTCHRRDLAATLWDDMIKLGIKPRVANWTALIEGYSNDGAANLALSTWTAMQSEGIKPDTLAYRAMIFGLFKAGQTTEAWHYFRKFEEDSSLNKSSETTACRSVYNTVVFGLLDDKDETRALDILKLMQENGPPPDIITYNTFISYYGRRDDFKNLAKMMNEITAAGLAGDVFTFSSILTALLRVGRENATETVLGLMHKQGIAPNVATYSAIIDAQMREYGEHNFKAALWLLARMEHDPLVRPNDITYTTILAGLYRGAPWLTPEMAEVQRRDIVARMAKQRIAPNRTTYRILLKACIQSPYSEGLRDTILYYRQMVQRGIPFDQSDWYILLAGMVHRQAWDHADQLVVDLRATGFRPAGSVQRMMMKIKHRVCPED